MQEDLSLHEDGIVSSWNRLGVSDLDEAIIWYEKYLGFTLEEKTEDDTYAILSIPLNNNDHAKSL